HGADRVREVLPPRVRTAFQAEQLGTGHATGAALAEPGELDPHDVVVILYGDAPRLGSERISELASLEADGALRMVTADLDDPSGYGRVLRDDNGNVVGVVEDRDATEEQKAIREVNAGIYAVRAGKLAESL